MTEKKKRKVKISIDIKRPILFECPMCYTETRWFDQSSPPVVMQCPTCMAIMKNKGYEWR